MTQIDQDLVRRLRSSNWETISAAERSLDDWLEQAIDYRAQNLDGFPTLILRVQKIVVRAYLIADSEFVDRIRKAANSTQS